MIALDTLCQHCLHTWKNTQYRDVLKACKIDRKQQKKTDAKLQKLLDEQDTLREHPDALRAYLKEDAIWDIQTLPEEHQKDFCTITRQFILDAKAFDTNLSDEEIFQALRNVWIILMLEMTMRKKLFYHRAMFAYSMLYPYTDNFLDSEMYTMDEKNAFNQRLRLRLKGHSYENPRNEEKKIDELIQEIEKIYDRHAFPDVYESLLCIQRGQEDSLLQQGKQEDILAISIRKGGSSVLADGFLINGNMSDSEQKFCMEYGFALQLADDLQDYAEDLQCQHYTLFSKGNQEVLAKQLLQYAYELLKRQSFCDDETLCVVIQKGCLFLVLGAIIMQREIFPPLFIKQVLACFPITKEALNKFISTQSISTKMILDLFVNENTCFV